MTWMGGANPFESQYANTAAPEPSPEPAVFVKVKTSLPRPWTQAQEGCRSVARFANRFWRTGLFCLLLTSEASV
jgi:hypothetical protein